MGKEKKNLSFFRSKTDVCRCQQSHAVERNIEGETVMEERVYKNVEWHKTNCVTKPSNGCESHYCS